MVLKAHMSLLEEQVVFFIAFTVLQLIFLHRIQETFSIFTVIVSLVNTQPTVLFLYTLPDVFHGRMYMPMWQTIICHLKL